MSTFKAPRKIRRIVFDEPHELAGLELRIRGMSVHTMLQVSGLARLTESVKDGTLSAEDLDGVALIFRVLADALLDWNLVSEDEEGQEIPVPPTLAGIESLELDFALAIFKEWMSAISGVSEDLKADLKPGVIPAEILLPMEAL